MLGFSSHSGENLDDVHLGCKNPKERANICRYVTKEILMSDNYVILIYQNHWKSILLRKHSAEVLQRFLIVPHET